MQTFSETRPNPGRSSVGDEARGEHDIRLHGCQLDWTNAVSGGVFFTIFHLKFVRSNFSLGVLHLILMNRGTSQKFDPTKKSVLGS